MRRKWFPATLAVLFAVTGCAVGNPARIEMDYSTSYKLAIAGQTLDPAAAGNKKPVMGMQAPEASKIYERYVKGFEKPAGPEQAYIIPVGAQGGTFK
jgi:hypothetical protein